MRFFEFAEMTPVTCESLTEPVRRPRSLKRREGFPIMRIVSAIVMCATLLVAACQTQDPYTGEEKTSHATRGAVLGGLLGAGIGALTNTSHGNQAARNALIGAGIGALAGA